jgi:hypothetical protein
MTRISHINELYGGDEALEKLQRREARFFNTCMMATALGAAVSDALEDGREVSGIGGQYNFVAMAHALRDGRSVLLFRAIREAGGQVRSSVLWNYGTARSRATCATSHQRVRHRRPARHGRRRLRARDAGDHRCALRAGAAANARSAR